MNLVDILNNNSVFFIDENEGGVLKPVSTYDEDNEEHLSLMLDNDLDIYPSQDTKVEVLPNGQFTFKYKGKAYRFIAYTPAWD